MTANSIFSVRNSLAIAIASLIAMFLISLGGFSVASAQTKDELCQGANLTFNNEAAPGKPINCGTDAQGNKEAVGAQGTVNNLVGKIINIFSVIVGIVAVIMIIVGGFRFITSGGDSAKVTSARNTIIYAIIGLIIVALAQIIVKYVLTNIPT